MSEPAPASDDTPSPSVADLDLRERLALAALERRMLGDEASVPVVGGRYVLLEELGAGGMGVVRRAFDRELRREVALKFLRLGHRARGVDEARLSREARTLAQLSHPHIVEIYDVQSDQDAFFVAMELVSGGSVREWLAAEARPWSSILDVFLQAADGLIAAHEAGLVHRDVKPSNLMLGDDGRVRVVDFGIARHTGTGSEPSAVSSEAATPIGGTDEALTRPGMVLGTPGYVAPEQLGGRGVDARSDQFAWCVSLYEALHGRRPYSNFEIRALADGESASVPAGPGEARRTPVPAWLHAVLVRGLAADPKERWPSMAALVDAIAAGRRRRRRWPVVALGLGASVAGLVGWMMLTRAPVGCAREAAAMVDSWNDQWATRVREAFAATEVPYAEVAAQRVHDGVDRYVRGWTRAHAEVCATDRTAPSSASDRAHAKRRLRCLAEHRVAVSALVDVLVAADAEVVRRSSQAVAALPRFDTCQGRGPDGHESARHPKVVAAIARAAALVDAGRVHAGLQAAEQALAAAEAIGAPRLVHRARREYGVALHHVDRFDEAVDVLSEAYFEAVRLDDPLAAATTAAELVMVTGERMARPDDALSWARHARALVEASDLGPAIEVRLLQVEAIAHRSAGQRREAIRLGRESLARFEILPDADPVDVAWTHNNLGIALQEDEQHEAALAEHEHARRLLEGSLGPVHPDLSVVLNGIGGDLLGLGRLDDAREAFANSLAVREAAFGPDHLDVAASHNNLGVVLVELSRFDEASEHYRHALRIHEARGRDGHWTIADLRYNLGFVELRRGDHVLAVEAFGEALDAYERAYGPSHPNVAEAANALAVALEGVARYEEARALHRRALRIRESALGADSADYAASVYNLGLNGLKSGDFALAERELVRARALADALGDADRVAEAETELARARRGERLLP